MSRPLFFIPFLFLPVIVLLLIFSGCGKYKEEPYHIDGISLRNQNNFGYTTYDSVTSVNENNYDLQIVYHSDRMSRYDPHGDYHYKPGNHPTLINVYSLQNFDSLHPANSSLNSLFIPGPGLTSHIDDVLTDFTKTDVAEDYSPTHTPTSLWLMKPPRIPGVYNFVVVMKFDDGNTFSDTTFPINLHQ
jgi:hypothetical protein